MHAKLALVSKKSPVKIWAICALWLNGVEIEKRWKLSKELTLKPLGDRFSAVLNSYCNDTKRPDFTPKTPSIQYYAGAYDLNFSEYIDVELWAERLIEPAIRASHTIGPLAGMITFCGTIMRVYPNNSRSHWFCGGSTETARDRFKPVLSGGAGWSYFEMFNEKVVPQWRTACMALAGIYDESWFKQRYTFIPRHAKDRDLKGSRLERSLEFFNQGLKWRFCEDTIFKMMLCLEVLFQDICDTKWMRAITTAKLIGGTNQRQRENVQIAIDAAELRNNIAHGKYAPYQYGRGHQKTDELCRISTQAVRLIRDLHHRIVCDRKLLELYQKNDSGLLQEYYLDLWLK